MKILEITIYGYGKFENQTFSNIGHQQVFFGQNEAGKSTIMSFIHSILFGFPTRQQSELRYEPKKGAKYGGQLTVFIPDKGRAVIERVKGKAAGDVVVTLENGMIGGEKLLKELLSSIDKQVFQAIFSFNLQGLQNVQQMKGEDIGRFLFSTGSIGTDRLLKAENELVKELELLFKPNGRNPKLNSKLKELRGLRSDWRKAEENNEQYTSLLKKRDILENNIKEMKAELADISLQFTRLEEWKKVFPLMQKEKQLQQELSQYDAFMFPENGLEELERLKQYEQGIERKINTHQERIERLKQEMMLLEPNVQLIEKENELMHLIENLPLLEKWEQETIQLQVKLKKLEEEILQLQNKMHVSLAANDVLSVNTSIFMKEKVTELNVKQNRLSEKKRELDERFQEETRQLEELEAKEAALKGELLPEEERKSLQEKMSGYDSKEMLESKYEEIKSRVSLLTASLKKASAKEKQDRQQYMFFIVLFLLLCGWGIYSEALMLILAGGAGLIFAIFSYVKICSSVDQVLQSELQQLQDKKRELEQAMRQPNEHIVLLEQKLKRDTSLREQIVQIKSMLVRQRELYDQIIDRYEVWERDSLQLNKELLVVGAELGLPDEIAMKYLLDAFELIDELKKLYQEQKFLIEQDKTNRAAIKEHLTPMKSLIQQFIEDDRLTVQEGAHMLKRSLRQELDKRVKYKEKEDVLAQLQDEYEVYQLEWKQIHSEITTLYKAAEAVDEQHFRELAKKAAEKNKLEEEWKHLSLQLKLSSFSENEGDDLSAQPVEVMIQDIGEQRDALEDSLARMQEELATIKYHIQMLEDGGSYAEILHRYKQLKAEFEEDAREWAVFSLAKDMLQKTVNKYKEERLPRMLNTAEKFLEHLTEGGYTRIIPKPEGSGFLIESKDHLLYEANELSQATTEQIYVSLRLALALTLYEKYNFPIIIDDSFVNFDKERTSRVIELLKELKDYQILFFTCHEHLLPFFSEAEITYLNQNSVSTK